ncbi:MAG: hypothetical protein IT532_15200 [Burkholderiales bacterium]|nr:hypothetical protein [Burkholderiales bacterium]
MNARARRGVIAATLAAWLAFPAPAPGQTGAPQPVPVTAQGLKAAERLFDVPAYRQLATRQLYRALASLPEDRYTSSVEALKDPEVIRILRGVIARSMAQTYSLAELEFLARMLSTDEGRSIAAKDDLLQDMLTRELIAAALTNPELARLLGQP